MKTIIAAALAALSLSAVVSTAHADTFTVHGVWDQISAEKMGK